MLTLMALTGQAFTQSWQMKHLSLRNTRLQSALSIESAPEGHTDVHAPQWTHFSSDQVTLPVT